MKLLADRLRAGETLFTAWSYTPDPLTVDGIAETAFDAVTLDMQHGGHHESSALNSIPAILRHGKPAIVRIPVGRFDLASRVLDFGADAVIAPMINSIADARAFASAMKYPPVGGRSWGVTRAVSARKMEGGLAYLKSANRQTLALAMIETREAYGLVAEILAIDGIDGIFVGPSDFSIAWTGGETVDAALDSMMPAIAEIAGHAEKAGKVAAIYILDPAMAARYRAMGYRLIAIASENRYMAAGASQMLETAKA